MITPDDVRTDIPIDDIVLLESALGHEKNSIGVEAFCDKYERNIEDYKKILTHEQFCYLLGYIKYHDLEFEYDTSVKLDNGYFIDVVDLYAIMWDMPEEADLEKCWNKAIPCFKERGFLLTQIGEAM